MKCTINYSAGQTAKIGLSLPLTRTELLNCCKEEDLEQINGKTRGIFINLYSKYLFTNLLEVLLLKVRYLPYNLQLKFGLQSAISAVSAF